MRYLVLFAAPADPAPTSAREALQQDATSPTAQPY
jgi:hypothetical protein